MAYSTTGQTIEALATEIGDKVYIDIANWHLFLREAHLHIPLAEHLYPLLEDREPDESRIQEILGHFSVKLGGGKREVSLADLVPSSGIKDLADILEEFRRDM
jgi:hypothetical protein